MVYKIRLLAAVGLLLGFALFSIFQPGSVFNYIANKFQLSTSKDDNPMTKIIRRLDCIRDLLPESGIVGYAVDQNGPIPEHAPGEAGIDPAAYQMTQYSLAPLVVENSLDHEWIIGDLSIRALEEKLLNPWVYPL